MMRNKNIESLRGIAILLLLFYHFTVSLTVFKSIQMIMVNEAFCQFAMITFFMISGYGTFLHYQRRENRGDKIRGLDYIKQRFHKIAPAYYVCLIFVLLFTTAGAYISRDGFKSIIVYAFLVQNLVPSMSGDINGVTWTIALFMQFYLISYPVYKTVKKWGWKSYPLFLVVSLCINKVLCGIVTTNGAPEVYYVIASIRQIFTTIDIFAFGMICGSLMDKHLFESVRKEVALISAAMIFLVSVGLFVKASFIVGGIWGDGFKYYAWKPAVSAAIGCIILLIAPCKVAYQSWIGKGIQFVAKVEYNTYLWHMILFANLKNTSVLFNELAQKTALGTALGLMVVAIAVGYVGTKLSNSR